MKLLFLNLPYKFDVSRASRWPEKTKSGTLYYPYWLCYAAGLCMKQGYDIDLVDCITKKLTQEQTAELVAQESPEYVMCEVTTSTCTYDYETLHKIRAACPTCTIIVGGTHATALPEQVLKTCEAIDIVVRQEYDHTLRDILVSERQLDQVLGITYRSNGKIISTSDRPWLSDMDEFPFVSTVYEKFLNVNDYCYSLAQSPMIQIFSARGCPFRCNFCSYPETMGGRIVRKRSVGNFVDELQYIHDKMPYIKEIFIEDDTFTIDRNRVTEICDEIIRRGLHLTWSCNARADLPYDLMEKMKAAGCRLLVVGYESGCQRVLEETRKGITLEQSLEFSKNAKKLKLKVFGCFMIGLKGDDRSTIEETFQFAKRVYPDMCFFQQAVPFPGTSFYQWTKENGYLRTEDYAQWLNQEGYLDCLVDYPYASHREIEQLRDHLMSRYYFSATYIFKTFLANLSWQEFKRVSKAGFNYIRYRMKKLGKQS